MIHWHLSVYQLPPAWLVFPQALSAGIAVPGHETHRFLQARLALLAFEDLEVPGCTFHKEEHQSCRHQPNNNYNRSLYARILFNCIIWTL